MATKLVIGGLVQIPTAGGGSQTPLLSDIDAAGFSINNVLYYIATQSLDSGNCGFQLGNDLGPNGAGCAFGGSNSGIPLYFYTTAGQQIIFNTQSSADIQFQSAGTALLYLNAATNSVATINNILDDGLGNSTALSYTGQLNGVIPYADGTYTIGLGVTTNGTITLQSGMVVNLTEAS